MSRIEQRFRELKCSGRKGFIPFISAGDPDSGQTRNLLGALETAGADVIELGVPFSDPMADGPTIQRSSDRALASGITLTEILAIVRDFRCGSEVPVVLFSYLNPIYSYGLERLSKEAADSGVDGILITDAIDEEAEAIGSLFSRFGIDLISLIAPTTPDARLERIARSAKGFLYAVSRTGVTGTRVDTSSEAESLVERARRFTDLPIAVGFGISTASQVEKVWQYADAAVVGSAIVSVIERNLSNPEIAAQVGSFAASLVPKFANGAIEN